MSRDNGAEIETEIGNRELTGSEKETGIVTEKEVVRGETENCGIEIGIEIGSVNGTAAEIDSSVSSGILDLGHLAWLDLGPLFGTTVGEDRDLQITEHRKESNWWLVVFCHCFLGSYPNNVHDLGCFSSYHRSLVEQLGIVVWNHFKRIFAYQGIYFLIGLVVDVLAPASRNEVLLTVSESGNLVIEVSLLRQQSSFRFVQLVFCCLHVKYKYENTKL